MGSQTLEILRQGVWASLTGGWFYDPHQSVFSNIVHLYLWLFLLCSPFVTYLYFPGTWITWCMYCVVTSLLMLIIKLANMALHRLYDHAQTMSEANIKQHFFKVSSKGGDGGVGMVVGNSTDIGNQNHHERDIEMKVMRNSMDVAINELSAENSLVSIDNVNSIIDLKVDVHRKNSSESIELMLYAPSLKSTNTQQDQQSLASLKANTSKSLRSTYAISNMDTNSNNSSSYESNSNTKYQNSAHPLKDTTNPISSLASIAKSVVSVPSTISYHCNVSNTISIPQLSSTAYMATARRQRLDTSLSTDMIRSRLKHRLERQNSLDGNVTDSALVAKLIRQLSDTSPRSSSHITSTNTININTSESFSHNSNLTNKPANYTTKSISQQNSNNGLCTISMKLDETEASASLKISPLQRHGSSETHEECAKSTNQKHNIYLPLPKDPLLSKQKKTSVAEEECHSHKSVSSNHKSDTHLTNENANLDVDNLKRDLNKSIDLSDEPMTSLRLQTLKSWILGSSSDGFVEDENYTKSDLGIEHLHDCTSTSSLSSVMLRNCNNNENRYPGLLHPLQQMHYHAYRLFNPSHIRKHSSRNTASALQLPVAPPVKYCRSGSGDGVDHNEVIGDSISSRTRFRRHSNVTTFCKDSIDNSTHEVFQEVIDSGASGDSLHVVNVSPITNTVTCPTTTINTTITTSRIKSTVVCSSPIVVKPLHPNSVEIINEHELMKNSQNSLLPPINKNLVFNPHSNLYSIQSDDNTINKIWNYGSANALIDVIPIDAKEMEETDELPCGIQDKIKLDTNIVPNWNDIERLVETELDDMDNRFDPHYYNCDLQEYRKQHKQYRYRHHLNHSAESDVGEFLNDTIIVDSDDDTIPENDCIRVISRIGGHEEIVDNDNEDIRCNDGDNIQNVDDEFKDFDYNVENILEDLQQTQNQLDEDLRLHNNNDNNLDNLRISSNFHQQTHYNYIDNQNSNERNDHNQLIKGRLIRERLHSTDSETDNNNNGSRSPLLSSKKRGQIQSTSQTSTMKYSKRNCKVQKNSDHMESNLQQIDINDEVLVDERIVRPNEVDSGCPSSDCEQISSSSKDMLLSGMENIDRVVESNAFVSNTVTKSCNEKSERNCRVKDSPREKHLEATKSSKSLGAIPKKATSFYRESMDDRIGGSAANGENLIMPANQLYKRHAGNWTALAPKSPNSYTNEDSNTNNQINGKTISRIPSSLNSSHCVSDNDLITSDVNKMLWLMQNGATEFDETVINTNIATEESGASLVLSPRSTFSALSSSFSSANMYNTQNRSYQEAFKAIHLAYSAEKLSFNERLSCRDKILHNNLTKSQCNESDDIVILEDNITQSINNNNNNNNNNAVLDSNSSGLPFINSVVTGKDESGPLGMLIASPTSTSAMLLNTNRNVSNATTISLQGFFHDFISDELRAIDSSIRVDSTVLASNHNNTSAATAAILNVDGHHLENYCDYWRPACMLSTEKPSLPPKSFYKYRFKICGYAREFKVSMDRLELLALFDRDLHWLHIVISVILSALVAYLGACILQHGYYKDVFAFLFCGVIASSQYSLLKSVQPDAASPIHGFNKTVAYSRAIYFCMCGSLLLLLKKFHNRYEYLKMHDNLVLSHYTFFGLIVLSAELNAFILNGMYLLLLSFPIIFSLGLFPQINTFLMYLMEQIDMHIFGGNAAGSLLGSFMCILRSLWGVIMLYGPIYATLVEMKGTQHIWFSIFCALLVPIGYHLSRSASDFSHTWAIIKKCIMSTYHDDDELSNSTNIASSEKLSNRTPSSQRLTNNEEFVKEKKHTKISSESYIGPIEIIEMSSLQKIGEVAIQKEQPSKNNCKIIENKVDKHDKDVKDDSDNNNEDLEIEKNQTTIDDNENCKTIQTISKASPSISMKLPKHCERIEQITTRMTEETETDKVSTTSTTNPGEMPICTVGLNEVNRHNDGEAALGQDDFTINYSEDINNESENLDPLPKKLQQTVNTRLKNDLVVSSFLTVAILSLHSTTVFTVLQPDLNIVLYSFTGSFGFLLHYIIPQMRKHMPWLCFAHPVLRQREYGRYEVSHAPKIMWFEKFYIYMCLMERNVLFPLLVISALTADSIVISEKYGNEWGALIITICGLKFIRNSYSDSINQYLIIMFTVLFFRIDFVLASETFLIDYFFVSLAYRKCCDFLLKLQFIVTYIAPWQITWGSAFHAFAQPFSVPHSAMLFLQAAISAILSTPLNPFLGSAIFLTSYVRPMKFWERDYNTRRIDHSNTRLSSQLERDLGADDNNLNSIFYEHLTRSLQHSLCGDLIMGRWGNVNQGDCFVLASDYLNCLVHIIELGNGLCTFQMRGLEFRGTYCQQREVEAITEDVDDNDGCCCCDPGHLPRILSANAMFSTRWLAWQVVASQYVVEGYSISDNLASATLQVFEYRKVLITYYLKSIIYYVLKNAKLEGWLNSTAIQDALRHTHSRQFVDLDPIFNVNLDEDFDFRTLGITRSSFCYVYLNWINFCYEKRKEAQNLSQLPSAIINHSEINTQTNNNLQQSSTAVGVTIVSGMTTGSYGVSITTASTPNLSFAHPKFLSQQYLRLRSQKNSTINSNGDHCTETNSSENMSISHSLASISRQASESVPGLNSTLLTRSTKSAPVGGMGGKHHNQHHQANQHLHHHSQLPYRGDSTSSPRPDIRNNLRSSIDSEHVGNDKLPSIKLKIPSIAKDHPIVSLCLALGLLARRSLATASHSSLTGVEFFLHGLHALFKGDFRITSPRDEWVFADMDLLHAVVAPAVKMALKLQQDHISNPDEFRDPAVLYDAIDSCGKDLVISHEADPVWRSAVLRGAPNLLALRHVMEDGSDEYRIIRLTKRFLTFRVIKLNRECVRGLWAGQQQELIYLRNRNPERGSIQNAKQALRNIINSSCDQPIGYPIYVSPLTTSYADTNEQLKSVIGGPITPEAIKDNLLSWWHDIREKCRQGCSSGSALETAHLGLPALTACNNLGESGGDINRSIYISPPMPICNSLAANNIFGRTNITTGVNGILNGQFGSDGLSSIRANLIVGSGSISMPIKPNSTTLLAGFLNREQELIREPVMGRDKIIKGQLISSSGNRGDGERRATLPITNTSYKLLPESAREPSDSSPTLNKDISTDSMTIGYGVALNNDIGIGRTTSMNSPCHIKPYCSSDGNLGLGTIITTPGEYPRKNKGPICLTSSNKASTSSSVSSKIESVGNSNRRCASEPPRKVRIELFEKVIIVDENAIYYALDEKRNFVWPYEAMRLRGGRLSWNGWLPQVGMMGYVVHMWSSNHPDIVCCSIINRDLYLLEIGDYFVPINGSGIRPYKHILEGNGKFNSDVSFRSQTVKELTINTDIQRHRRRSLQREMELKIELLEIEKLCQQQQLHEKQQLQQQHTTERSLTPILGSSLESPTSHLDSGLNDNINISGLIGIKAKIQAVSSSSSEDETELLRLENQRRENFLNMWKQITEQQQQQQQIQLQLQQHQHGCVTEKESNRHGNDNDSNQQIELKKLNKKAKDTENIKKEEKLQTIYKESNLMENNKNLIEELKLVINNSNEERDEINPTETIINNNNNTLESTLMEQESADSSSSIIVIMISDDTKSDTPSVSNFKESSDV